MSAFSEAGNYEELIECCQLVLDRCHDVDQRIVGFGPRDARRLAIADVQKYVAGLLFSLLAVKKGRRRAQVKALFGSSGPSTEQGQEYTEGLWRFGLTVIVHFRIDSMFQVILKSRGEYKAKSSFTNMLRQILDSCQPRDRSRIEGVFLAATYLRNSFHNNGVHRGSRLNVEIQQMRFDFEPNKAIGCASFAHVLGVVHEMMGCLEEIFLCPSLVMSDGQIVDDWIREQD